MTRIPPNPEFGPKRTPTRADSHHMEPPRNAGQDATGTTTHTPGDPLERRVYPRHRAVRAAKLCIAGAGPSSAAQTFDYSAGGALVDVHAPRSIKPGQRVELWIEFKVVGVLPRGAMHPGTVVRAAVLEGERQRVAVRFDRLLTRAGD